MALGGKSRKAKVKRFLSQGSKRWGAKGKTAKGWRANVAEPSKVSGNNSLSFGLAINEFDFIQQSA